MVEPISDDELQVVRDALSDYANYPEQIHHLKVNGRLAAGLLARLDAAESRAAELRKRNALLTDMLSEQGDMLSDVMVKHGEIPPC